MSPVLSKLKQFRDLRKQAKAYKNAIGDEVFVGASSDDLVKITIDGTQKMTGVSIDPSLLTAESKEKLEKDLLKASEDAQKQLQAEMLRKVKSGELTLPGNQG